MILDQKLSFSDAIGLMSLLIRQYEKYYFTSHSRYVSLISKKLAQKLELDEMAVTTISVTTLLYSWIMSTMPARYILQDPGDMKNLDHSTDFFERLNEGITRVSQNEYFKDSAWLIAQLWELHDGTGLPNNLPGAQLSVNAQIIAISAYYHNHVYRLPFHLLEEYNNKGIVQQSPEITMERHEMTIKKMYRYARWFDVTVFREFMEINKRAELYAMIPRKETLEIINTDYEKIEEDDDDEIII